MKLMPVTRRLSLAATPHLLADADGVLSAADLETVTEASALVAAVRARCAAHLRASRRRQQQRLARQRAACESGVLSRMARLSQQLQDERRHVRETAATLVARVARDALQRLMVELPEAWPAQSSVQLVLAEWSTLGLKDEATVHLHPDDLPLIAPLRPDIPWTVAADASLPRGVCVLSHSAGTVRADFHANLEALKAALNAASRSDPSHGSEADSGADRDPHPGPAPTPLSKVLP
ncbi:FliH/SctL family protein [Roseateles terrae]|uniref:Flagellar biosynthesis/type III secretory pathway protein FliH n=1 Tax=Roseateles terrae TaxID=431060 RepID=A0ABR6GQQ8_9BURK|nr:FliH/SctL family protein [Roseateles terrae]MBB3194450.1 flagellar biosynthesis/type III secretory pathway protein FliH [Roseateles terrae]OWQ88275.1 hypothetical protein CDN98_09135 [Roseateles terrae]